MSNISIRRQQQNVTVSEPRADYHLPIASDRVLGGIKVGGNLTITSDGTLSADPGSYTLPVASTSTLGGIKVGSNLSINDGVLTADVDSVLQGNSSNPVQNSVITSNISAINSTLGQYDTRLDNLENSTSTLSSTVASHTNSITTINGDITSLETAVGENTTNIGTNTGNIVANSLAISNLDDRLDSAEDNISAIQGQLTTAQITSIVDDSVSYTSLLPVATWTSGDLTLHKRSLLGFLFINLEGNFLLGANSSTTIYTLQTASSIPLYTTSATVFTDAGNIVLSATDQGEIQLTNPTSSALTITKVYGNVPLVY